MNESIEFNIPKETSNVNEIEKIIESQLIEKLGEFHTGSVLLIQNQSDPASVIVRSGLLGRFSHSAIYLSPEFMNDNDLPIYHGKPLLWQAAGEKRGVEGSLQNDGPDLHSMAKFLSFYIIKYPNSRFILRNLGSELKPQQQTQLLSFIITTIKEHKFEFCSNFELIWTFYTSLVKPLHLECFDRFFNVDRSKLSFCSKLVTETYQSLGIVDPNIDSFTKNPNFYGFPNTTNVFDKEVELIFNFK
eukprot:gene8471-10404_t